MNYYIQRKQPRKSTSLYAQARAVIDARNKANEEREAETQRAFSVAAMMLGRPKKYEIKFKF